MDIYPSILETNIADFRSTLEKLLPIFNHFQLDIADGKFVQNRTIQIEEVVSVVNGQLSNVKGKTYDFHLMVSDYPKYLKKLNNLKNNLSISNILIHLKVLNKIFNFQFSIFNLGVVLNPEDDVASNLETISKFETVQLMTVNPGRQGSPFLPEELEKINQLRDAGYKEKIILDGGINEQTMPIILKNKHLPDAVAPGSFFAKAPDPKLALESLKAILASKNTP